MAVVPQRPLLFSGSIADNLRWGDEAPPTTTCAGGARRLRRRIHRPAPRRLRHAARAGRREPVGRAEAAPVHRARPAAQAPRARARRLHERPDGATEVAILRGLRELAGGITLLLISQRISTVRRADAIVCLENGRMQGFGTHDDLMRTSPTYRAIYDSQTGGAHA